jgi:hypothetical protein
VRIFGREPAWWIVNVLQPAALLVLLVTPWSAPVTAAVSGLVTVVGGALLAATVSAEKALPLAAGASSRCSSPPGSR